MKIDSPHSAESMWGDYPKGYKPNMTACCPVWCAMLSEIQQKREAYYHV